MLLKIVISRTICKFLCSNKHQNNVVKICIDELQKRLTLNVLI